MSERIYEFINGLTAEEWMQLDKSTFQRRVLIPFGKLEPGVLVRTIIKISDDSCDLLLKKCWDEQEVLPEEAVQIEKGNIDKGYKYDIVELLKVLLTAKVAQYPSELKYRKQLRMATMISKAQV